MEELITLTVFDFSTFNYMLQTFESFYGEYTSYNRNPGISWIYMARNGRGRPSTMISSTGLALLLAGG